MMKKNEDQTRQRLSNELVELRQRIVELEASRTEHKRTERALRQRNRELELLNQANQAFGSSLELDQVLTSVLEEARYLLDVTSCSIWLIDQETQELVCRQAADPHSEIMRGWRLEPGQGHPFALSL